MSKFLMVCVLTAVVSFSADAKKKTAKKKKNKNTVTFFTTKEFKKMTIKQKAKVIEAMRDFYKNSELDQLKRGISVGQRYEVREFLASLFFSPAIAEGVTCSKPGDYCIAAGNLLCVTGRKCLAPQGSCPQGQAQCNTKLFATAEGGPICVPRDQNMTANCFQNSISSEDIAKKLSAEELRTQQTELHRACKFDFIGEEGKETVRFSNAANYSHNRENCANLAERFNVVRKTMGLPAEETAEAGQGDEPPLVVDDPECKNLKVINPLSGNSIAIATESRRNPDGYLIKVNVQGATREIDGDPSYPWTKLNFDGSRNEYNRIFDIGGGERLRMIYRSNSPCPSQVVFTKVYTGKSEENTCKFTDLLTDNQRKGSAITVSNCSLAGTFSVRTNLGDDWVEELRAPDQPESRIQGDEKLIKLTKSRKYTGTIKRPSLSSAHGDEYLKLEKACGCRTKGTACTMGIAPSPYCTATYTTNLVVEGEEAPAEITPDIGDPNDPGQEPVKSDGTR